jgi:hypothetical protein
MRHAPCPVLVLRSPEGVNETGTVQRKQKEAIL